MNNILLLLLIMIIIGMILLYIYEQKNKDNYSASIISYVKKKWFCTGNCNGKECGNDGCLNLEGCGVCQKGGNCINNQCVYPCVPDCNEKECGQGEPGCGNPDECGVCKKGSKCINNQCVNDNPVFCCQLFNATCLACKEGITVQEFCALEINNEIPGC